jgi:hypothetical protein
MSTYSGALTTTSRVKDRLDLTVSTHDTLLEDLINAASAFIETQTDRTFKEDTYTQEQYDGFTAQGAPRARLVLAQAPVSAVSTIEYRPGTKASPNWTEFLDDEWELIPGPGVLIFDTFLPRGYRNIRVTYTAGYKIDFDNDTESTHTLPYEITDLAERLVVKFFKRRQDDGRDTVSLGQGSFTFGKYLDEYDRQVLANYHRFRV